jgi:hypothetical protein
LYDQAQAYIHVARQFKLADGAMNDAAEIKLRSGRALGQILACPCAWEKNGKSWQRC